MLKIRKAALKDVPAIFRIINHHAANRVMLPRPLPELYESVREFLIAEEAGVVLACGALKLYSPDLAEIRSLCVAPGVKSRGIGRALMERLVREAASFGLKTVFALTLVPEFFAKCGFRETTRERFPAKIWRDCAGCRLYSECQEKTVYFQLSPAEEAEELPAPAHQPESLAGLEPVLNDRMRAKSRPRSGTTSRDFVSA